MLEAAKDRPQLHLILETICGTGIRVADAYWKQIVSKAAKLLADQEALREMIQAAGEVGTDEK